ncbi:MAG: hypothetical protein ACK4SY_05250 [Pyrobaculum sp.]
MSTRIYFDESGEPRARIVEAGGQYVISLDVFHQLPVPPPDAEVLQITERYKILWRRKPLLRGVCELLYFQSAGGVQLINIKYLGPDDPEAVLPVLLNCHQEEVAQHKKEEGEGG